MEDKGPNTQSQVPPNMGSPTEKTIHSNPMYTKPERMLPGQQPWKIRFERMFYKMEIMGVRTANFAHKSFVTGVLCFVAYNVFSFVRSYNHYWRLRRDPNVPKQWLEEQTEPGQADWGIERERVKREERMIGRHGLKDRKYYD